MDAIFPGHGRDSIPEEEADISLSRASLDLIAHTGDTATRYSFRLPGSASNRPLQAATPFEVTKWLANSAAANLPLAARPRVGHIRLNGAVAEWLKAAVC